MVGTIEPRKGHSQALSAVESLWNNGMDLNLVIVGKKGWDVDDLTQRLKRHKERNTRLFWFQGISDHALQKLYENATGILMASEGEGFGLPLIEAAQHGCPVLARDIKVFHEIAGNNASYFSANSSEELAAAIKHWLAALQTGTAPQPELMPWLTWKQSTRMIIDMITNPDHPNWLYHLPPQQEQQQSNTTRLRPQ